jgi:uncharacterized membrane protein YphA (DoxX/SURF4 family)
MNTIARHTATGTRLLLGVIFFVFGLNGFLQFLPQPPVAGKAMEFMGGLAAAGYMFPLIKGIEVIAGALLLTNRFVPLALAPLAPNVVNIVLFHAVLAPGGIAIALLMLVLEVLAAWSYRDAYASMLHARTAPTVFTAGVPVAAHAVS